MSETVEPTVAVYDFALQHAIILPIFSVEKKDSTVLIYPTVFAKAVLYTFVSECDRDTEVRLTHHETKTQVSLTVLAQRTALVFVNREDGKILARIG